MHYKFKFYSNAVQHEGELSVSISADNDIQAEQIFKDTFSVLLPFGVQVSRFLDE